MNYKIINILMTNRLFKKLYIFIGTIDNDLNLLLTQAFSKDTISVNGMKNIKKSFLENSEYWFKIHKEGIPIILINDIIHIDDTIQVIRKKIFLYLSTKDYLLIENNQELWVENDLYIDEPDDCIIDNRKYLPLGYYYNNYKYTPSVYNDILVDYENFVDTNGISLNNYELKNNLHNILNDVISVNNIKNNTIYINNLEFEQKYMKDKHIIQNDTLSYGYLSKFFPKKKPEYNKKDYKDTFIKYRKLFEYESYLFSLINKNTESIYLNKYNIVAIRLRSNNCQRKIMSEQSLISKNDIDLMKIFNLLEVSEDILFIKYKKTIEQFSPMIKIHKDSVKKKFIDKKLLLKWILSNPRGLLIKKYMYTDEEDNRKYMSLNIFPSGTIEINMAFSDLSNINLQKINELINNISKLIHYINKTIIHNKKQFLVLPSINIKGDIIKEDIGTKILYINYIIPINNPKLDKNKLSIISENFSPFIIKSFSKKNEVFRFKYKRISNFKNLHDIFFEISEKKSDEMSNNEIKKYLQDKYNKDSSEIQELFTAWNQLMGYDKDIKQKGIDIQIPNNNNKIKILGCSNIIEIYTIQKLMNTIFDISFNSKKYEKNKDFRIYFKKEYSNIVNEILNENNSNNENININKLNLSNFNNLNNSFKNYLNNNNNNNNNNTSNNTNNNISNTHNNNLHISSNEYIDPVLRLGTVCKTSGKDKKADTCGDLCEDFSYRNRRLQKFDNKLFRFKSDKATYSKQCQKNTQPLVLKADPTKNPKIKKDSYTYAMEYGSDLNHKNFYICPKVWCPHCEIPLNYDEIKDTVKKIKRKHGLCLMAKCPHGNHDVFVESDIAYDKTNNGLYPGFVKNKHPDGYCLPCCKKVDMRNPKYTGHKQMKQCLGSNENNNNNIEYSKYILDSNKIPLDKNRYGANPVNIQKLFKNIYNHGHVEIGKNYFVRAGIKLNQNQSFLECIAKIMSDISKKELKLVDLKRFLISKLDNENLFKSLNNGNLELIFKNETDKPIDNYKKYLNSDTFINEKYVIDFLSRPDVLDKAGLNIFIITSNLIKCFRGCNIDDIYDLNRDSVFIFNYNQYYEPIYLLKYPKRNQLERVLKFNVTYSEPTIFYNLISKNCRSYHDIDWNRLLKDNEKLLDIKYTIYSTKDVKKDKFISEIKKLSQKYQIKCQVVDTYNKMVGYVLNNNLFYPIEPTNIDLNYEVCDKDYDLLDYKNVIKEYDYIKKNTKLPYKIVGKVIDSSINMVNILVLETGRYIRIQDTKAISDSIALLDIKYYSDVDDYIQSGLKEADKREDNVRKFDYDTESYHRYVLELSKHAQINQSIKDDIKSIILLENKDEKLKQMIKLITSITKTLVTNKRIINIDINNYIPHNIRTPCYLYKTKYSKKDLKSMCMSDYHCSYIKDECKLYFPELSFFSNTKNNDFYIEKLSNDLVKNRLKYFNFIKDKISDIKDDTKYYPQENEYYLYGIDYLEQFEKIFKEDEDYIFSDTYNYSKPLIEQSGTMMYSILKEETEDEIYLDELVTHWKNLLGITFKIFRVNVNNGSLFSAISRCYNEELVKLEVHDILTINKLKNMLVDYLNELTIAQCKDLFRLYLKIEDLSNTNEIQPNKIKRPKDLIYEMYKNICMYKEILDFNSLIDFIENFKYDGCKLDILFLSRVLNMNIIVLHYRKIPSNPNSYNLYKYENSNKYILIYSEVFKDDMIYNSIQKSGTYVFEKEDFSPEFIKALKL